MSASFYIVGLYWHKDTHSDPMLVVSQLVDPSEYAFCIILEDVDYCSQGAVRNHYVHHPDRTSVCKKMTFMKLHCYRADTHTQFEFPTIQQGFVRSIQGPSNMGQQAGSSSSSSMPSSTAASSALFDSAIVEQPRMSSLEEATRSVVMAGSTIESVGEDELPQYQ